MKSNREAYGEALAEYGKDPRVVVLDADVSGSTKSNLFACRFPDRFYNVGIAEANMCAMACGMASEGKIPFVNTFAAFATTLGLLPIRSMAAYMRLNVRLMGAYCGMSDAYDGATHHSLDDLAIMRAVPNMAVLVASDTVHTRWLVKKALEYQGPMYIRLSRDCLSDIYPEDEEFQIGTGKILREGTDCTIIACGSMLTPALEAAKALSAEDISARVVDMFSVKPIDRELVMSCARETGAIVTVEEHSIVGGLGSAVAELLAEEDCVLPFRRIGVQDTFTQSGSYSDLLLHYGLTAENIVQSVKQLCGLCAVNKIKGDDQDASFYG